MSRSMIARYVNPWKYKREQAEEARLTALRARDGDNCARCRRSMRFDLPAGFDQGAVAEAVMPGAVGEPEDLGNLRLCHRRCNASGVDHTGEVTERMRRKNEAALFTSNRKRA